MVKLKHYQTIQEGNNLLNNADGKFVWIGENFEKSFRFPIKEIDSIVPSKNGFDSILYKRGFLYFAGANSKNNKKYLCKVNKEKLLNKVSSFPLSYDRNFDFQGFGFGESQLFKMPLIVYSNCGSMYVKNLSKPPFNDFKSYECVYGLEKTEEGNYLFFKSINPFEEKFGLSFPTNDEKMKNLLREAVGERYNLEVLATFDNVIKEIRDLGDPIVRGYDGADEHSFLGRY